MLGLITTIVLEGIVSYWLTTFTGSVVIPVAVFAVFWLLLVCCGIMEVEVSGRLADKISNGIFAMTLVMSPIIIGSYFAI